LQSLFAVHPKVSVHPVGLGVRNETLEMKMCPRGSPNSSLVRDLPDSVVVPIPIRCGDDYRIEQNLPAPHVIKIDVEGFEPQVLKGLEKTIREARPIIFFEHIWISDDQVQALVPDEYDLIFVLDTGALTRDMRLRRGGANAVILPAEKGNDLRSMLPKY
jgi:FkbM family methyltransferase